MPSIIRDSLASQANGRLVVYSGWVLVLLSNFTTSKKREPYRTDFYEAAAQVALTKLAQLSVLVGRSLVGRSLVQHTAVGRYSLHNAIRPYGGELLRMETAVPPLRSLLTVDCWQTAVTRLPSGISHVYPPSLETTRCQA